MSRLARTLGAEDRATVREYLDSVREVERRIQKAEAEVTKIRCPISIAPSVFRPPMPITLD